MTDVRRSCFLMAAVAMALAAAGCVPPSPAVEIMMDPNAPVTQAPPVYAVGSSWTYDLTINGETQRYTGTIVEKWEVDGREVDVHAKSPPNRDPGTPCDGANGEMFDAVTHNWMACLKDGEVLGSLSPHAGYYAWPLEVGKSWQSERAWTDNVIRPDWSGSSWEEWTVVAWEEVTVPAGTFMAYKIVRTGTSWETTSKDLAIYWYAPEFGGGIKGVFADGENSYRPGELTWEMVSNDPKYPAES